jgi:hypothetical protein
VTTPKATTPRLRLHSTHGARPAIKTSRQTSTKSPAVTAGNARYLRRWMSHQAALYNDLLETIATATHPHSS